MLKSILLVDDDESTNFFHQYVIKKSDTKVSVQVAQSAQEAIHNLQACPLNYDFPELILLDINMPAMNGWEFVEWFKTFRRKHTIHSKIIMLTTSFDPDDKTRARKDIAISDFYNKPLTSEALHEIIKNHF